MTLILDINSTCAIAIIGRVGIAGNQTWFIELIFAGDAHHLIIDALFRSVAFVEALKQG